MERWAQINPIIDAPLNSNKQQTNKEHGEGECDVSSRVRN